MECGSNLSGKTGTGLILFRFLFLIGAMAATTVAAVAPFFQKMSCKNVQPVFDVKVDPFFEFDPFFFISHLYF